MLYKEHKNLNLNKTNYLIKMKYRTYQRVLKRWNTAGWETKKCSTLLLAREIQVKPYLRFYLIPVRMTKILNKNI